jgi:hypothetical protein
MEIGGVGGHSIGQVSCGRAGHCVKAEFDGTGYGHGDYAILIREGRVVDGVIFDVEFLDPEGLPQPMGADKRRETGVETNFGLSINRQKFAIAPEIPKPGGNFFPADAILDLIIIVNDL